MNYSLVRITSGLTGGSALTTAENPSIIKAIFRDFWVAQARGHFFDHLLKNHKQSLIVPNLLDRTMPYYQNNIIIFNASEIGKFQ